MYLMQLIDFFQKMTKKNKKNKDKPYNENT